MITPNVMMVAMIKTKIVQISGLILNPFQFIVTSTAVAFAMVATVIHPR